MEDVLLPIKHIAFIMDGNGRWAIRNGTSIAEGHRAGAVALKKVTLHALKLGIQHLTAFCFSTENWNRSDEEVSALMKLFETLLNDEDEVNFFSSQGVKLNFLGDMSALSPALSHLARAIQDQTKNNRCLQVNLALNYGGRQDIIAASKRIFHDIQKGLTSLDQVNEDTFSKYLFTCDIPDPDLLIRTSGEQRISNFLIYQCAYSEFYFSPVLWPDFDEKEFDKAIENFYLRQRRFGGR